MRLRHHHVLAAAIVATVVLLAGTAAGWFAFHYPYRTVPAPKVPAGQKIPNCVEQSSKQHHAGSCLPQPTSKPRTSSVHVVLAAAITSSTIGPDLSNNDPVTSDYGWSQIASRSSWAIFKVSEGTGFRDGYAAAMGRLARAHGLTVGGYDFLHVCGDDAGAEARTFVAWLNADGLSGAGTFPPVADAEYGGSGCDARGWMSTWVATVVSLTHRQPLVYTGAWWWGPHLGSYWPNPSLSWISGYGVSYPYMPSGRSQLDLWQFSDNGYNGYTNADLSNWRDGAAAFQSYTASSPPPNPYAIFSTVVYDLGHNVKAAEQPIARGWNDRHCLHPTIRNVCGFLNFRLKLLVGRLDAVTRHWQHTELMKFGRLKRVRYMQRQIAQTKPPWPLP